jgi:HPr kinase/phosphorylase
MSDAVKDRSQSIHATAVVVGEAGILIRGRSGRGKSALALALLDLAGERGLFARLIGDDRVFLEFCGGRLLISGAPEISSLIERRGYGLEKRACERTAVARLVIDLLDEGEIAARMPETADETAAVDGVRLRRLVFDDSSRPLERARVVLAALIAEMTAL